MMKSGVPGATRRLVMREGGFACCECGLAGVEKRFPRGGYGYPTAIDGVHLSIDHIVARARGGDSSRSNLRVMCTTCNTKKGTTGA